MAFICSFLNIKPYTKLHYPHSYIEVRFNGPTEGCSPTRLGQFEFCRVDAGDGEALEALAVCRLRAAEKNALRPAASDFSPELANLRDADYPSSARINRHVVGNERVRQERRKRIHLGPESCG